MATERLSFREKVGYALGDGAANIAWRGVSTFLFIFYTDVFGLDPIAVGLLMLVARFSDGISDIAMGAICDRFNSKYGKFRPWILWTAVPLALILSLLFTTPDLGGNGKLVYAYITYILFTLIYTANNIPYGALMGVMTGDDKERTILGSFRMAGAFTGGMIVQGTLLYLVMVFGNVNPEINIQTLPGEANYRLEVSAPIDVENANIKTKNGIATFLQEGIEDTPTRSKSFSINANKSYTFQVSGENDLSVEDINLINQRTGYKNAIYLMSVFLAIFMVITFLTTKERVFPPKAQQHNFWADLKNLTTNKPWLVLLFVGLLFNIYTAIKQGIIVIYFVHYLHNELLAGTYMVALTLASIGGALATGRLAKAWGKKNLFIYALLFSGVTNALIVLCGPENIPGIFVLGIVSEFASAVFPTLFFTMLGDAADYSEWKDKRRATGLIYSAGSFATKFGGGIAAAIIGFILSRFNYDGQDMSTIEGAIPGIIMLMSWVPAIVTVVAAIVMSIYPLNKKKMETIVEELEDRRISS